MNKQKTKTNNIEGYKLNFAIDDISNYYFGLKISGHPELLNLRTNGLKIFGFNNFSNKKLSQSEIINNVKKYIYKLSKDKNIPVEDLFRELNKKENNLEKRFRSRLFNYFSSSTKILTSEMINTILTGNTDDLYKIIDSLNRRNDDIESKKISFSESVKNMLSRRKKSFDDAEYNILDQKNNKSKNKSIITESIRINESLEKYDKSIDNLFSCKDLQLKCAGDLNNYKNLLNGIEANYENLRKIYDLYIKRADYYKKFSIDHGMYVKTKKIGKIALKEKISFNNDQQVKKYLSDKLGETISNELLTVFYSEYKK